MITSGVVEGESITGHGHITAVGFQHQRTSFGSTRVGRPIQSSRVVGLQVKGLCRNIETILRRKGESKQTRETMLFLIEDPHFDPSWRSRRCKVQVRPAKSAKDIQLSQVHASSLASHESFNSCCSRFEHEAMSLGLHQCMELRDG